MTKETPFVPMREQPSRLHRLIVGVDYGTTYSGLSFVTTDKASIDDIQVIDSWPALEGHSSWKVPTRYAYARENQGQNQSQNQRNAKPLKTDVWGCAVRPGMVCCAWTKLLLDTEAIPSEYDDLSLQYGIDNDILHYPQGPDLYKSPQDVCEDFLRKLYRHLLEKVIAQIGEEFLRSTPMDCWLTVPATWSDKAQESTRRAAKAAGFGSRPGDNIYIISEPEAAAIATFKSKTKPESPNPPVPGENILVCDAGGGTVDVSTYNIVATSPSLVFDELCVGMGRKCGSTSIDRNLHELMLRRFGESFERVDRRRKGPGSEFMERWEWAKRSYRYDAREDAQDVELGPLNLSGNHPEQFYDVNERMVLLSSTDMEGLFKPVIDQVLGLISDQIAKVAAENGHIKRIILVGGFADSHYLLQSIRAWGKQNGGIQVLCAAHPQAAIVQGAALRGLEGTAPRKKRVRRHYGVQIAMPFREGIDPESNASFNTVDGVKRCRNRVDWMIAKGTAIRGTASRRQTLAIGKAKGEDLSMTVKLLSCPLDVPPDYANSDRVETAGTVKIDFSNVARSNLASKRVGSGITGAMFGQKHWNFIFELEVIFGAASSNLTFRVWIDGAVQGTAHIEFD